MLEVVVLVQHPVVFRIRASSGTNAPNTDKLDGAMVGACNRDPRSRKRALSGKCEFRRPQGERGKLSQLLKLVCPELRVLPRSTKAERSVSGFIARNLEEREVHHKWGSKLHQRQYIHLRREEVDFEGGDVLS